VADFKTAVVVVIVVTLLTRAARGLLLSLSKGNLSKDRRDNSNLSKGC